MKKIMLGKTNTMVSTLGLGCINYGTTTDEKTAFSLMDTYVEEGGNLLDTANNYAFWNGGVGRDSERVVGNWIHQNHSLRKDLIVCTKLGALPADLKKGFQLMQGNSRGVILSEVQKSLETLQTDYIDLLYLHVDDFGTPLEETMEALAEVIRQGYVRYIGCSNFRTWRIEKARILCKEHNLPFFSAVQQRYSYVQPVIDADFSVQVAADKELESYLNFYHDLTMVSHSPLLNGLYFKDSITDPVYDTRQNRERLEEVRQQGEYRVPYVLHKITEQFGGSIALFTSSNKEHLLQNMHYFDKQDLLEASTR